MLEISNIVVNFNNSAALFQCVTSLLEQKEILQEIIIVDNASTDDSVERLGVFADQLTLIRLPINVGFGNAINVGAAYAKGKYLSILNNDVQLSPLTLSSSIKLLESREEVVCLAPRLILPNGKTQKSCRELPYLLAEISELLGISALLPERFGNYFLTRWNHSSSRYVEQAAGACLFLLKSNFEMVGGFDGRFPLYYEDVDLCRKLNYLGKIWYSHEIIVKHTGEATARKFRAKTTVAIALGKYRYYLYNTPRLEAEFVRLLLILRCFSRCIVMLVFLSGIEDYRKKARGYWLAIGKLIRSPLFQDVLK